MSIATQKGINLHAVKGEWQLDGSMPIIAMAFAMAAEYERALISQRTKKGASSEEGGRGTASGTATRARQDKLDPYQPEIKSLLANGAPQRFIAKRYGTTEANLHHWLKKRGLKRKKAKTIPMAVFVPLCGWTQCSPGHLLRADCLVNALHV